MAFNFETAKSVTVGEIISGGTNGRVLYDNNGVIGETDSLSYNPSTRVFTFDSFSVGPTPRFNVENAEFNIGATGSDQFVIMDSNGTLVPPPTNSIAVSTDHLRVLLGGASDNTVSPLQVAGYAYIPSIEGSRTISADYTVLSSDSGIFFDADSATIDVAVTLPLAAAVPGKVISLTKINSGAHYAFFVPSGSDTIIGNLSPSQYGYADGLTIKSDGVDKWVQIAFTQAAIYVGAAVLNGTHNSVMYTDNTGVLASNSSLSWDTTTLTVGTPDTHESQILLSTFMGQDGAFIGSGNGGPTTLISSPYYAFCLATNPGGDGLGTGIIGINGQPGLIEWKQTGELYFKGLQFPSADGTANQAITTDGAGVLSFADITAVNANYLYDTTGTPVIAADGVNRLLYATDGTSVQADWSTPDTLLLLGSDGSFSTDGTTITLSSPDGDAGINFLCKGQTASSDSTTGGEAQFLGGSGKDSNGTTVSGAKFLAGAGQANGDGASLSIYLGAPTIGLPGVFTLANMNTTTGSDTATFTNAPAAGDPGAYLEVVVNGSTYAIPLIGPL